MKKLLQHILPILVLITISFCSTTGNADRTDIVEISLFIEGAMIEYFVPGVSIAVINDFKIDWAKGFGETDIETREPVTVRTLFQAASISKPVAAMAALKFVQDEKIRLDDNINLSLESWKIPDNRFTENKKVTLKNILSHTGGLTVNGFRGYKASERKPDVIQILNGEEPSNSAAIRVDMEPGTEYRYSGGGYTVMQQALLDITQKPFPRIMRETVLSKLDMDYSTYDQPLPESLLKFASSGHGRTGDPIKEKIHIYPEMAAAGLWTTASDLARFAVEIQNSLKGKSNKVLSQETAQEMTTPYISENYALGLQITERDGKTYFGHGGSNAGFKCFMIASIDEGVGVVIMTNGDLGNQLYRDILEKVEQVYNWNANN